MLKWKDALCVLCLFAVSTATIHVALAAGTPCTGYGTLCQISQNPLGPAGATCCKNPAAGPVPRYISFGTGNRLYVENSSSECGDTATVKVIGTTAFCYSITSTNTCGGKSALPMCSPTPP